MCSLCSRKSKLCGNLVEINLPSSPHSSCCGRNYSAGSTKRNSERWKKDWRRPESFLEVAVMKGKRTTFTERELRRLVWRVFRRSGVGGTLRNSLLGFRKRLRRRLVMRVVRIGLTKWDRSELPLFWESVTRGRILSTWSSNPENSLEQR